MQIHFNLKNTASCTRTHLDLVRLPTLALMEVNQCQLLVHLQRDGKQEFKNAGYEELNISMMQLKKKNQNEMKCLKPDFLNRE